MPPPTPVDLSQDPDFLAAPRDRQIQYLSAKDPNFASAQPDRQQSYLDHLQPAAAPTAAPSTFAAPPGAPIVPQPVQPETSMLGTIYDAAKNFADKSGLSKTVSDAGDTASQDLKGLLPTQGAPVTPGGNVDYGRVALGALGLDPKTNEAAYGSAQAQDQSRKAHGYGPLYRAVAPEAQAIGVNVPGMEKSAREGSVGGVLGHTAVPLAGLAAGELLGHAAGPVTEALGGTMDRGIKTNLVGDTYSKTGDHIASALRSNTKVDVPAEAKIAAPAIEEGLNDKGFATQDFKGRNGPAVLQAGVDNALDIQEARAKSHIDPIRSEPVPPEVLAKNPELASRFMDKDGNLPKELTYGDLDAERLKMNKELRTSNFYSKPPSAQYAVGDPLANLHDAANQVRDLVYDKVLEKTGTDIRPLKRVESALIKLGDLAETTKNTLSPKVAQQATTPFLKKLHGTVAGALSVKANPINAFSIPEKSGLFNPSNEFNAHMQKAFPNLKAATADRTAPLQLAPPPGVTPPAPTAMQQLLNLSGGENIPGENLKLTHPPGKTPPAPNAQEPLPLEGGENVPAKSIPDILGQGLIGAPGELTSPPGNMPPALQRVLPFQNPGVPSDIYPGVKSVLKAPKKK